MPTTKKRKKRTTKSIAAKDSPRRKADASTSSVASASSKVPKKLKKKTSVSLRSDTTRVLKRKKKGRKKKKKTESASPSTSSQDATEAPSGQSAVDVSPAPPPQTLTPNRIKSANKTKASADEKLATKVVKDPTEDLRYNRKEMDALQHGFWGLIAKKMARFRAKKRKIGPNLWMKIPCSLKYPFVQLVEERTKENTTKEGEEVKKKKKKKVKKTAGKKKKKKKTSVSGSSRVFPVTSARI